MLDLVLVPSIEARTDLDHDRTSIWKRHIQNRFGRGRLAWLVGVHDFTEPLAIGLGDSPRVSLFLE